MDHKQLLAEALHAFETDIDLAIAIAEGKKRRPDPVKWGADAAFVGAPSRHTTQSRPEAVRATARERVRPSRPPRPTYSFPITVRWTEPKPDVVVPPRIPSFDPRDHLGHEQPKLGRPPIYRTPEEIEEHKEKQRAQEREAARRKYWKQRGYDEPPPIREQKRPEPKGQARPRRKSTPEERAARAAYSRERYARQQAETRDRNRAAIGLPPLLK